MNADTSVATASAYMFVLGLGLGLVMQVLVLAVQNAVDYSELGVATSGATLFRSIGGSFGASVLGAVFANQLAHNLAERSPGPARPAVAADFNPAVLAQLPPAVHDAYVHAFTDSLNVVFLVAAAIGVAAFVCSWFIKELPLRDTVATAGVGEAFAVPKDTDPLAELARELSILTRREQAGASSSGSQPALTSTSTPPRPGCSDASTATPTSISSSSPRPTPSRNHGSKTRSRSSRARASSRSQTTLARTPRGS